MTTNYKLNTKHKMTFKTEEHWRNSWKEKFKLNVTQKYQTVIDIIMFMKTSVIIAYLCKILLYKVYMFGFALKIFSFNKLFFFSFCIKKHVFVDVCSNR